MLVTLIGKNRIYKVRLPQSHEGSYWICNESGKKLINIEGYNDNWQITSNNQAKILNTQSIDISKDDIKIISDELSITKKIFLREYSMHIVQIENNENAYILYCSPVYEKDIQEMDIIHPTEITIGKAGDNDISYNNTLISDRHARIYYNGETEKWNLQNYDKKYGVYVNDICIDNDIYEIENGDLIFIMGLKITMVGNKMFVNNPGNRVKYMYKNISMNNEKIDESSLNTVDGDEDIEIYSEKDYFSRAPKIINKIETEKMTIDSPPALREDNDMPAILTMGSSLGMGVMMMISMSSAIEGIINKTASIRDSITRFGMSFSMLIGMLVFPIITRRYQKREKKKYEKKRQSKYKKYINSKITILNEIMESQRKILEKNYPSADECEKIVLNKDARIWERKLDDQDFLSISLGRGDIPLDIDIHYPEERFSMEDDNLVDILSSIGNQGKILENAPLKVSLSKKNVASIISSDDKKTVEYMKELIMQLVTLHSYRDLKLVFLLKEDTNNEWDFVKMLPHLWNNTKSIRFWADDYNDMKVISKYLDEVLEERIEQNNDKISYRNFPPYYLIITNDYKKIEGIKIIIDMLKLEKNLGFSLLCITDDITQLPNECKTFINMEIENGEIFENENTSTTQKTFKYNEYKKLNYPEVSKILSNIPIKYSSSNNNAMLPETYTFLQMYDVGKVEQLNILDRWYSNDTTESLKAPIGIDSNGMIISLDIHEKYHGPHGLIAGSTGSGKSEFIITYILSLAINYHPDDVNFVLIDYKGGGLAGAFKKKDVKLPHLVGTITNIDKVGLQRSLDSIQSELRKRQVMFNEARDMTEESTIDIYKYQKLYHDGIVKKAIPHLFIICDEFAELKQQQPDFMDELISVARIGRSLGVHLILATQKPAGIVNEQIRSNSKFGVCLKVQDRSDSMDIIKKPDAARLKKAGQFYINVGNDEYFALGQSGWAGAKYYPSDIVKKEIDTSVEFITSIGSVIKKVNNVAKQEKVQSNSDQLTSIVNYLAKLAKEKNIDEGQLWLDSIPQEIFLMDIRKKYNIKTKKNYINPVIGEYDDPFNQSQGALTFNLSDDGNAIIYGSVGSGKENLLNTMIYDIITTHSIDEVQFFLLDFGSETLKCFNKTPHVGDVVLINDSERVIRLMELLKKEITRRKEILAEYNGEYKLYINTSKVPMPMWIVVINNYSAFLENYDKYEDDLAMIARECTKYGINIILTATSYRDIRSKLSQNFKNKLVLQMNNEDDYVYILDKVGKKRPSRFIGRGLVPLKDGGIYEFQTAKVFDEEKWNLYIKKINEKLNVKYKRKAIHIPILPNRVVLSNVKKYLKNISCIPIGIAKKSLNVVSYDFSRSVCNIITSKNMEEVIDFIPYLGREMEILNNIDVILLDYGNELKIKDYSFENEFNKINVNLKKNKKNGNSRCTAVIILGFEKFSEGVSALNGNFDEILKQAELNKNCFFIICDSAMKLKQHQYENWYKSYVPGDSGIWIGNGVDSQYVITAEIRRDEIVSSCGNTFGYTIKQGQVTLLKLIGVMDKEEESE